jgi:O-antigen ligase
MLSRATAKPINPIWSLFTYEMNTGAMVWLWLAVLAGGQVLFNHSLAMKWKVLLGGLILAQFASTVLYGRNEWVSGWLPALIAILILIWLRSWRRGLVVLALGAGVFLAYQALLIGGIMTPTQQYSISSRGATLPILLELIKANPLLGLGPANYHFYTPLYSILGWHVQFNSHNNYIDMVAQTGLIGLALFGWLIIALARSGWKLRRAAGDGFSRGYVNAALAGLAGIFVSGFLGDWFLPFLYNVGIPGFRASLFAWLFLGGLVALENIDRGQSDLSTEA